MSQRKLIDLAVRKIGEDKAKGYVINVWGVPELRQTNERYCTEPIEAVVIYHPNGLRTNNGGFVCPDCGHATDFAGDA